MPVLRVGTSQFVQFSGRTVLASMLLASAAAAPAYAAPITFAFEAQVQSVVDFHGILPPGAINVRGQNDITLPDHWFTFNARLIGLKEVPPDPIPAPEPSSVVLTLAGLAAIARRGRSRLRAMRWE